MRKAKPVALVAAGNLNDSPVSRLGGAAERLGPIQSSSLRLASRIANGLRAGHPVKDFAGFDLCRLILISMPDDAVPAVVAELARAGIRWHGKSVVLCSTWLDSSALDELRQRGASTGSVSSIAGLEDHWYLVEGDAPAIRESRSLLAHRGTRVVAIQSRLKSFYLAALTCTGSLLFPLVLAASDSLRHAGVSKTESAAILEKQVNRTLRGYLKAGLKAGPSAYAAHHELSSHLAALARTDPSLAVYIERNSELAARLLDNREGGATRAERAGSC